MELGKEAPQDQHRQGEKEACWWLRRKRKNPEVAAFKRSNGGGCKRLSYISKRRLLEYAQVGEGTTASQRRGNGGRAREE